MLDPHLFRQTMGCFTTGIAVVTTRNADGQSVGLTVNSLTSVSLDPPLVLLCLDRKAHFYKTFRQADHFVINILSAEQEAVSRYFADQHHHPRPKQLWDKPRQGVPVLRHTLAWMVCKATQRHKGGDHDIFVGEVIAVHKRKNQQKPLLYFHGRYREIAG